jgi:predicted helicase
MGQMLAGENLGLITTRQTRDDWAVLATDHIMGHKSLAAFDINFLFPLYLHPQGLFEQGERTPNLNPKFLEDLNGRLGLTFLPEGRGDLKSTFGPEDVFSYAYAVFHAPAYRQRYAEFLRGDFPRLPLTGNKTLFAALVEKGAELVALHLLEAPTLDRLVTSFPVSGSNKVEQVRYEEAACRVYINDQQFFEGVPQEAWAFQVGGYQVLHKWLKDRKGRTLSFADLHHYQKVVVALVETIRLMAEIDAAIDAHAGWPLGKNF